MSLGSRVLPEGAFRIVDLTYPLRPGIPYWPGSGFTSFQYRLLSTVAAGGVATGFMEMPDHTGTHVDAPVHFAEGGRSIGQLDATELIAPAVVIDMSERAGRDTAALLDAEHIEKWTDAHGSMLPGTIVLINAGWSARWGDATAFRNTNQDGRMAFPGVSPAAAAMLAADTAVAGIGVDTLSPDNGLVEGSPCHKLLHGAGKLILENVARLDELPARDFVLFIGVLPIVGGTAAPCRLIALVPVEPAT